MQRGEQRECMEIQEEAHEETAGFQSPPSLDFWNLSTPQPASINTSLSPVLTRTALICSPTGLDGWNVDVSRPLASSARSPHSVSAGNASGPSLTTVISMVPSLQRYERGCARLPAWGA